MALQMHVDMHQCKGHISSNILEGEKIVSRISVHIHVLC